MLYSCSAERSMLLIVTAKASVSLFNNKAFKATIEEVYVFLYERFSLCVNWSVEGECLNNCVSVSAVCFIGLSWQA